MDNMRCKYCDRFIGWPTNKQGAWGLATCRGCKGSLTTMLRSGKYGATYSKATKQRLLQSRYDWNQRKWIIPTQSP